jgi:hypothetical protein
MKPTYQQWRAALESALLSMLTTKLKTVKEVASDNASLSISIQVFFARRRFFTTLTLSLLVDS